jgi:HAMP domain-containing protein
MPSRAAGSRPRCRALSPLPLLVDYGVRRLLIGAAAWFGARWLTLPVRRLVDASRSLGDALGRHGGTLPRLDKRHGTVEVREAAQVFNRMASRLSGQCRSRGLLMASISHDLRTPLTRMRLRIESLADEPLQPAATGLNSAPTAMAEPEREQVRALSWAKNHLRLTFPHHSRRGRPGVGAGSAGTGRSAWLDEGVISFLLASVLARSMAWVGTLSMARCPGMKRSSCESNHDGEPGWRSTSDGSHAWPPFVAATVLPSGSLFRRQPNRARGNACPTVNELLRTDPSRRPVGHRVLQDHRPQERTGPQQGWTSTSIGIQASSLEGAIHTRSTIMAMPCPTPMHMVHSA